MARVEVTIDGSRVVDGLRGLVADSMPNTIAAKREGMNHTVEQWTRLAQSTFMHSTGAYINAIGQREPDPFTGIVYNDAKHAGIVEHGHGEIDQKKALQTSTKTRWMWTKDGYLVKSLIVPFRHNIPGNSAIAKSMPKEVYAEAKQLSPTFKVASEMYPGLSRNQAGSRIRPGAVPPSPYSASEGATVRRASYAWGDRLKGVGGNYEGMVRMSDGGGYVTFRLMHERQDPDKWRIPAQAGEHLAKRTAEQCTPYVKDTIRRGILKDLGVA